MSQQFCGNKKGKAMPWLAAHQEGATAFGKRLDSLLCVHLRLIFLHLKSLIYIMTIT